MFHISQWVKLPAGASGSSTMSTRLFASLGTPSIVSVGLTSLPSQVKRSGMFPPSLKSGLLSFIACSDGIFALPVLVIRVSASIRTGSRVFIGPRILQSHDFFRRPSDKHLSPKGFKLDSGCSGACPISPTRNSSDLECRDDGPLACRTSRQVRTSTSNPFGIDRGRKKIGRSQRASIESRTSSFSRVCLASSIC